MRFVIAYDIVDDRKRVRVARLLRQYAVRTQKSTFEGESERRDVQAIPPRARLIARQIDATEDRAYIYPAWEVGAGPDVARLGAPPVVEPGPPPGFFLA